MVGQLESQPEGAPAGASPLFLDEVLVMRPLPVRDGDGVLTDHVRGNRQPFQVISRQRLHLIRRRQSGVASPQTCRSTPARPRSSISGLVMPLPTARTSSPGRQRVGQRYRPSSSQARMLHSPRRSPRASAANQTTRVPGRRRQAQHEGGDLRERGRPCRARRRRALSRQVPAPRPCEPRLQA